MNREALESLDKETLIRLALSQAETIAELSRQVEMLTARVVEVEAKLGLPPKTPDNSSTPPSQGRKPFQAATDQKVKRQAAPRRASGYSLPSPRAPSFRGDCRARTRSDPTTSRSTLVR